MHPRLLETACVERAEDSPCRRMCGAQVASKFMPLDSTLLGVDIVPIKPIRGCKTFIEDITTAKCRATVRSPTPAQINGTEP
jgi:hypothetical protein